MPGLRLETADEYGVVIHEPVAADSAQSDVYESLHAQISRIDEVDTSERGRKATAIMMAMLEQWNQDYSLSNQ